MTRCDNTCVLDLVDACSALRTFPFVFSFLFCFIPFSILRFFFVSLKLRAEMVCSVQDFVTFFLLTNGEKKIYDSDSHKPKRKVKKV